MNLKEKFNKDLTKGLKDEEKLSIYIQNGETKTHIMTIRL